MLQTVLKNWLMAVRPKTLPAAVAPVFLGTAMAFGDGIHHWLSAAVALAASVLIQTGTNLANDYFDFKKGADTSDRIGPTRVTQAGLIKPENVKIGFILSFVFAGFLSVYLIFRGGWPIAVIGVLAIASGILYTAGPRPLGYVGLGDLFVLIFFGPVAVGGTYYVQSFEINLAVIAAGFGPGLISAAILAVNNLRDIDNDRRSHKRTLAVRFGKIFVLQEYLFCIICASLVPVLIVACIDDHFWSLLSTTTLFFAIPTIITVLIKIDGPSLNKALAETGKLLMIYSFLFGVGWLL